jgi:hypothetical protein
MRESALKSGRKMMTALLMTKWLRWARHQSVYGPKNEEHWRVLPENHVQWFGVIPAFKSLNFRNGTDVHIAGP